MKTKQIGLLLPLLSSGRMKLYKTSFSSRVTTPFIKSTMNRDLAQAFPQIHADVVAALSPQLLHGGLTAHAFSRAIFSSISFRSVSFPL